MITVPVEDVKANGTSVLNNGIADIPIGGTNTYGVLRLASESQIKAGTNIYSAIGTSRVHTAVFYGLAKAAGDTTQASSSNAIGTYTAQAKAAIREMLGIDKDSLVAEIRSELGL